MTFAPSAKLTTVVPLGGWRPVSVARCILCNLTTDDPVEFNAHKCYERRTA